MTHYQFQNLKVGDRVINRSNGVNGSVSYSSVANIMGFGIVRGVRIDWEYGGGSHFMSFLGDNNKVVVISDVNNDSDDSCIDLL